MKVYAGEIYGFLGPNDSGKITTIKMLTGLLEPTAGEVEIAGFNVKTQPTQAKAVMAYVPDQPTLYPKLTAREFLLLMANLYRVPREEALDRCQHLLALFGLGTGGGYLARQAVELGDVTGWRVPVADAHRRPGDPPVLAAADKAERVLGWQPAYPDLATTV